MLYIKDLLEKEQRELSHLVDDLKAQLFTFHFKNSTGQQDQTHKIKLIRRDIARVLMAISMKEKTEGKKKISASKKKIKKTYSLSTSKTTAKKAATPTKPAPAQKVETKVETIKPVAKVETIKPVAKVETKKSTTSKTATTSKAKTPVVKISKPQVQPKPVAKKSTAKQEVVITNKQDDFVYGYDEKKSSVKTTTKKVSVAIPKVKAAPKKKITTKRANAKQETVLADTQEYLFGLEAPNAKKTKKGDK